MHIRSTKYKFSCTTSASGNFQQVGTIGYRGGRTSFTMSNDFFRGIGDKDDRWWTGSGLLEVNINNEYSVGLGIDIFTGEIRRNPSYTTGNRAYYGTIAGKPNLTDGRSCNSKSPSTIQSCIVLFLDVLSLHLIPLTGVSGIASTNKNCV